MHGASVFDMRMSTTAAFTPLVTSYTGNNPKGKQTRKQKTDNSTARHLCLLIPLLEGLVA